MQTDKDLQDHTRQVKVCSWPQEILLFTVMKLHAVDDASRRIAEQGHTSARRGASNPAGVQIKSKTGHVMVSIEANYKGRPCNSLLRSPYLELRHGTVLCSSRFRYYPPQFCGSSYSRHLFPSLSATGLSQYRLPLDIRLIIGVNRGVNVQCVFQILPGTRI
jgi:hypothetical protein